MRELIAHAIPIYGYGPSLLPAMSSLMKNPAYRAQIHVY